MARFFGPVGGPLWVHDLFWLLIVVAVVAGVFLIVRSVLDHRHIAGPRWGPPQPWHQPNPALHELDLRYARGEVDRSEYLQRRADLLGHSPPPGDAGPTPPA